MKGKRLLTVVGSVCLILMLVMTLLVGCAPEEEEEVVVIPTEEEEEEVTPAVEEEVLEWVHVSGFSPGMFDYDMEMLYCDLIEDMSGGRIQIERFPVGQICSSLERFDAIQSGMANTASWCGTYNPGTCAAFGVAWSLPWAFKTREECQYFAWYWDPCLVDLYREAALPFGVYVLTTNTQAAYGGMVSTVPIRGPDDVEGLKIRSYGIYADLCDTLGASVVTMASTEMYTGLALGTIDAAMYGDTTRFADKGCMEVTSYWVVMGPDEAYPYDDVICNADAYFALPDDLQEIVLQAARLGKLERMLQIPHVAGLNLRMFIEEYGIEVIRWSEEDAAVVRAASMTLWDDLAAGDPIGIEMIEATKDYMRFLGYLD